MRNRLVVLFLVAVIGAVVLSIGGVGVSLALENQDSFCASCHTEPEVTYYQQSLAGQPATLAAFHTQKQTACIDCHSGGGPLGRAVGLWQGVDDTMRYYSGNYNKPAITQNPLGNDSCDKCHQNVYANVRRGVNRATNGHYHQFMPRWRAVDPNAARCVSCHPAHTAGSPNQQFLVQAQVNQACDDCHRAIGRGD